MNKLIITFFLYCLTSVLVIAASAEETLLDPLSSTTTAAPSADTATVAVPPATGAGSSSSSSAAAAAPQAEPPVPPLLAPLPPRAVLPLLPIEEAYQKLVDSATGDVEGFLRNLREFRVALLTPIDANPALWGDWERVLGSILEIKGLLSMAGRDLPPPTRVFLRGAISPIVPTLEDLINVLRVDRTLLDLPGRGRAGRRGAFLLSAADLGEGALKQAADDVALSIANLTGRIFHIASYLIALGAPMAGAAPELQLIEEASGIGSGTLVSLGRNDSPQTIVPASTGRVSRMLSRVGLAIRQRLNGVLTCAHVLRGGADNRHLEVFFVPSNMLNAEYGLPEDVREHMLTRERALKDSGLYNAVGKGMLAEETNRALIDFLRRDAFRIDTYTLQHTPTPPSPVIPVMFRLFPNNPVQATRPRFFGNNEDIVIARLVAPERAGGRQFLTYNGSLIVNFPRGEAAIRDRMPDGSRYFAIGYPGCSHYQHGEHLPSCLSLHRAPLFITFSGQRVRFEHGRTLHGAPVSPGMSGGSLINFQENYTQINIVGVNTASLNTPPDRIDTASCYLR